MGQANSPQVREIRLLPVADIRIKDDRLRPVDILFAKGIAEHLLASDSEPLPPIEVYQEPGKKGWVVADGAHRLTGHQLAKVAEIEALIVSNSELAYRSIELQRTIFNKPLNPYDRAKHLAELYYIERRKRGIAEGEDPRKLGGRPPAAAKELKKETSDTVSQVSLSGAIGTSTGLSERQVQRDLMLFRQIAPSAIARLVRANHPALHSPAELKALAAFPFANQDWLLGLIFHANAKFAAAPFPTIRAAINAASDKPKPQKLPEDKRLGAFIGAFSRMSITEKKGALSELAALLPAGITLEGLAS